MYLDWAILLFTLYYTFRRINMLEKLREKWDEILNYMKEEHDISSVSFRTWLLPLELYSFENNTLYILVPDDQNFRQYLEKKYLFLLQISIEEIAEETAKEEAEELAADSAKEEKDFDFEQAKFDGKFNRAYAEFAEQEEQKKRQEEQAQQQQQQQQQQQAQQQPFYGYGGYNYQQYQQTPPPYYGGYAQPQQQQQPYQQAQGELPAQMHHQQQEGDLQQGPGPQEDAVAFGGDVGVRHEVGQEGALAVGAGVQQEAEDQKADVGPVLKQLPQVQLLLARGLPGGLGVGLPGEEGEEHGDKGQQAGHPEGGGHPHRGQQKGDEEAANHKEEGAHAAQQAVIQAQLVGVAHQQVLRIGGHGAPEEIDQGHQAEEQGRGIGKPRGDEGDEGEQPHAPRQHRDEHLAQRANAVADHAPEGNRGNGEDGGQGVEKPQLRGREAHLLQVDGLVRAKGPGKPENAVDPCADEGLPGAIVQTGKNAWHREGLLHKRKVGRRLRPS